MSDEEGEAAVDGEEDGAQAGPLDPCLSCGIGVLLLLASTYGLWWNEGNYVQTVRAWDRVSRELLLPCDSGCSSCDFNNAALLGGGKSRAVKAGDSVYLGCDVLGLENVGTALKGVFPVPELEPALVAADANQGSAAYAWSMEMFQEAELPRSERVPDLKTYRGGVYKSASDYCKVRRKQVCEASQPLFAWRRTEEPSGSTTTTAAAESTTATVTTSTATAAPPGEECKGLNKEDCSAVAQCAWRFRNCGKIATEEECKGLGAECAWAEGKCGKTADTWRFACKPLELRSLNATAELLLSDADGAEVLAAAQTCRWESCAFATQWASSSLPPPTKWQRLPSAPTRTLAYAEPPAKNVRALANGSHELFRKVRLGTDAQSVGLARVAGKVFPPESYRAVRLRPRAAQGGLAAKESAAQYRLSKSPGTRLEMVKMDRSEAAWTAETSSVGGGCPEGCVCSSAGARPAVGDLRACVVASATMQVSVIAKIGKGKEGWELREDTDRGMLVELDDIVPPEQLLKGAKLRAGSLLKQLRLLFPLLMWLGFYCCLSPILWVLDSFQELVGNIPCVGAILERLAGCLQSLAECAICMVSCLTALCCSLLVAALAWLRFRPLLALGLLAGAGLLAAGLAYFSHSRQGAKQVRRRSSTRSSARRSSAREVRGSDVEMQGGALQFLVVCPEGVAPGGLVQVAAPDGRLVQVEVPEGVAPGQQFLVAV